MLANRIIAVLILVLAAIYFYATEQIPSFEIGDPLGPRAFPRLLVVFLVIASVLLFFESFKRDAAESKDQPPQGSEGHAPLVIGGITLWTILYFWIFERVGFIIATVIYLFVLMAAFNRGKWVANALTAVLFSIGAYVLFVKVLRVNLPAGLLTF